MISCFRPRSSPPGNSGIIILYGRRFRILQMTISPSKIVLDLSFVDISIPASLQIMGDLSFCGYWIKSIDIPMQLELEPIFKSHRSMHRITQSSYRIRNGIPNSIFVFALPFHSVRYLHIGLENDSNFLFK